MFSHFYLSLIMEYLYIVFRKKSGSTFVIITLQNVDGF